MRTEWKLFFWLGVFMAPLGVAYWGVTSDGFKNAPEEAGAILLIVTAIAFFFVAAYLKTQSARMNGLRPEDYDATPAEGKGEVGSFPVGSIFPFLGAVGATVMGLGVAFNGFLMVPAVCFILTCVVGMARESTIADTGHFDLEHNAQPGAPVIGEFSQAQVKK